MKHRFLRIAGLIFVFLSVLFQSTVYGHAFSQRYSWQGEVAFFERNGLVGLCHKDGRILMEPQFSEVRPFVDDRARVCKDEKWGFIDKDGIWIAQPVWNMAYDYEDGFAFVQNDIGFGILNWEGSEMIRPEQEFSQSSQSHFTVKDKRVFIYEYNESTWEVSRSYVYNQEGELILTEEGELLPIADEQFLRIMRMEDYTELTAIDCGGKEMYRIKCDHFQSYSDFRIIASLSSVGNILSWGVFDAGNGDLLAELENCWMAGEYRDGMLKIECKELYGYLDWDGNMVIPPQFGSRSTSFSDGVALVEVDGRMRIIDKKGNYVSKNSWPSADSGLWMLTDGFYDQCAQVGLDGKIGFVNEQGELISSRAWDAAEHFREGYAFVYDESLEKWGTIDQMGNIATDLVYDELEFYLGKHYTIAGIGQNAFYVDFEGKALCRAEWREDLFDAW